VLLRLKIMDVLNYRAWLLPPVILPFEVVF
jgi:hypothetical protein